MNEPMGGLGAAFRYIHRAETGGLVVAPRPRRAWAGEHRLLRACRTFGGLLLTGAAAMHGGHRLDHVAAALLVTRVPFR